MKIKRRFLILFLAISLLTVALSVSAWSIRCSLLDGKAEAPFSVLLCGMDESGSNTDVMFVACVNPHISRFDILQIPRDTLVLNESGKPVKLNSRFSHFQNQGMTPVRAANAFKKELASLLGMQITHTVMLDMKTVAALVDDLGGIRVRVPRDMSYSDPTQNLNISISAGEHLLNGRDAVSFLRYRNGYLRGDLARMDAQKIFLAAVVERFRAGVGLSYAAKAGRTLSRGKVYSDMHLMRAAETGYHLLSGCRGSFSVATLPGEALYTNGTWYFVAARASADALLCAQFPAFYHGRGSFDARGRLCDLTDTGVRNAYSSPEISYKIYREDDLKNISL